LLSFIDFHVTEFNTQMQNRFAQFTKQSNSFERRDVWSNPSILLADNKQLRYPRSSTIRYDETWRIFRGKNVCISPIPRWSSEPNRFWSFRPKRNRFRLSLSARSESCCCEWKEDLFFFNLIKLIIFNFVFISGLWIPK